MIDLVLDREAAKAWIERYLTRAARELGKMVCQLAPVSAAKPCAK